MPFGLKNAPSIFQRKMDNIFRDNDSFVAIYIDDILVFSKSKKQHIGHLQIVLKKFEEHGIIISKSKMQLFQQTIEFLGVIDRTRSGYPSRVPRVVSPSGVPLYNT